MKRLIIAVFSSVNLILAYLAFIFYLSWYEKSLLDFGGRQGMLIGGSVFGVVFIFWQSNRCRGVQQKNSLSYYAQHVLINGTGLICSFAFGYLVELLMQVKDFTEILAIFPTILMIPLLAMFYSVMMVPFVLYLGITNGFLSRKAYRLRD